MASIKLRSIDQQMILINFHVDLNGPSSGYETDVSLVMEGGGWIAEISFTDMPPQETPEEALDRLGLYLRNMAKAVKGKNIKHLNVGTLFNCVHKK